MQTNQMFLLVFIIFGTSQFKALEQPNVFKMFYCKLIGVFQERISPNNAKLNQPIIRKCI